MDLERAACPDKIKRGLVSNLFALPFERVVLTTLDVQRANKLKTLGFKEFDAFHLAAAERGNCDVFLRKDDRLIARATSAAKYLNVEVSNPVDWVLRSLS